MPAPYTAFGELNDAGDNATLVTTWYSGTHQTFADVYSGSEHALDPKIYFIVAANQIWYSRVSSSWTVSDAVGLMR